MKKIIAAGMGIVLFGLAGCAQPPSLVKSDNYKQSQATYTAQPKKPLFPENEQSRKQFFMNEKHNIYANCGVFGDVVFSTGKNGAILIAGEGQPVTSREYSKGSYSFFFNGNSLFAVIYPDTELMGIKTNTGLVSCYNLSILGDD